jgi:uncharacterized protein DUF2809
MMSPSRKRARYFALAIGTIVVGIIIHLGGGFLPPTVRDVFGDALWAMMIVWWMGVAAPHLALRTRGLMAFAVCIAVELSQLYQTPFLDALRRTLLGHLVLGNGYDPRDFLAYGVGVALAVALGHLGVE